MKNSLVQVIICFVAQILGVVSAGPAAHAEAAPTIVARVVKVFDGDSLIAMKGTRRIEVRLYGIDCPEGRQANGGRARLFTKRLVLYKTVRIQKMYLDRHNRVVARVILFSGRELSLLLLKEGLAWWYQRHAPSRLDFAAAMVQAWRAKKGLWREANPEPPWEWRRRNSRRPR